MRLTRPEEATVAGHRKAYIPMRLARGMIFQPCNFAVSQHGPYTDTRDPLYP